MKNIKSQATMRALVATAVASMAMVSVAACGGSTSADTSAGPTVIGAAEASAAANTVDITIFFFRPQALQIASGTTVTWANRDQILHTVTAGTPEKPEKTFAGTLDGQGTAYSFKFDKPGTYAYFCSRHNGMRGEVDVT